METLSSAGLVVAMSCAVVGALGGVATAAPAEAPRAKASCVGQVFVPQATGEPGTIAARIHEIMDDLLQEGENFGMPISGLARDTWCR